MELLQTETCRNLQNNNEEKMVDMCSTVPYKETPLELDISEFRLDLSKKACLEQSDHKFDNILPPRLPANFRGTGLMSWRHSIEPPTSIGHLTFLLDCFVISFGPDMPQLGRYHPQSDPERYAVKSEDEWSLLSEEDFPSTLPWTNLLSERQVGTSVGCHRFALLDNQRRENGGTGVAGRRPERNFAPFQDTASVLRLEDADFATGFTFPDEIIIRELSEMRVLLERLLENRDLVEWNTHNGLRDILALLPDGNLSAKEPSPHFPVGEWEFEECGICFEVQWLYRRACCSFAACTSCLQQYYSFKVDQGMVKIECCNPGCSSFVHRDEISARLEPAMKEKFHKLLILANEDASTKTCPRCNHVTKVDRKSQKRNGQSKTPCVECPACQLEWCFACHAPWHGPLTCKQFRKGDRLLRTWAKEKNHGQLNAQKCPKCKIYIQRTTGCDHMHCTRCKADFCYRCGDRFRRLKFFGDHYSKLSVFGCKYRYKADRPLQRKFIRGAIFGGKIVAAPILGALALCAGALAVGVSVFALPVYGGVRLYRHCEGRQQTKAVRRQSTPVSRATVLERYVLVRDH